MCNKVLVESTSNEILKLIAGLEYLTGVLEKDLLSDEKVPAGFTARLKVEPTGDVKLNLFNGSHYHLYNGVVANLNQDSGSALKDKIHFAIQRHSRFEPAPKS